MSAFFVGWVRLVLAIVARGYLVFVLCLAACAIAPLLFGVTASVVQSGSMQPLIRQGDVVLSTAYQHSDPVPLGRVVTFTAPPGSARPGTVLHRIVAMNHNGTLVTAGDANADVDSTPLHRSGITGRAFLLVPFAGLPAFWMATGDTAPFVGWAAISLLAIALEVLFSSPGNRRPPPVPRPRLAPIGRVAAIITVAALLGSAAIAAAPGKVEAAFSARTTSIGNSWATPPLVPASKLAFTTQPSASTGGIPFASQPVVTVQTATGTTSTGTRTVTISLTSAGTATLRCGATTVTSSTGIVAFTGCSIDKLGTYTLTAKSGTLASAVSATVRITAGPGATLVFTAVPPATRTATVFATQPVVAILDAGGNQTTSTASVALALTTPAGATLACSANPVAAVSGVATYAGCRIDKPGTYSLTASSGSLPSAVSTSFVISAPVIPPLSCQDQIWMAVFSWTPTPYVSTQYALYVNGIQVQATGADGWNSYVQLTSNNVPFSAAFPAGRATVEVRQILANGQQQVIGDGTVLLGPADHRTYQCG